MKHKKFLSLALALAMIFSISITAFADDPAPAVDPELGNTDFTAVAEVTVPDIAVKVPVTGTLFINPMGFTIYTESNADDGVTAGDAVGIDDESDVETSNEKIVSPTYGIINLSPMTLEVTVNGVATLGATVNGNTVSPTALALASAPVDAASTKNEVFIYAQFDAVDETISAENDGTYDLSDCTVTKVDYNATTPASNHFAVPSKAVTTGVSVGQIIPADTSGSGVMTMKFFGNCAVNPKTDWSDGDKLTVSMTFTFKPVIAAANP